MCSPDILGRAEIYTVKYPFRSGRISRFEGKLQANLQPWSHSSFYLGQKLMQNPNQTQQSPGTAQAAYCSRRTYQSPQTTPSDQVVWLKAVLYYSLTPRPSKAAVWDQTKSCCPSEQAPGWVLPDVHTGVILPCTAATPEEPRHVCREWPSLKRTRNPSPGNSQVKLDSYPEFIRTSRLFNPVWCSIPKHYTNAKECWTAG